MADEVTRPRPEGDEEVEDIQVMLNSNRNPSGLRDLKVSIIVYCNISTNPDIRSVSVPTWTGK